MHFPQRHKDTLYKDFERQAHSSVCVCVCVSLVYVLLLLLLLLLFVRRNHGMVYGAMLLAAFHVTLDSGAGGSLA
jgi:hypothetical protein